MNEEQLKKRIYEICVSIDDLLKERSDRKRRASVIGLEIISQAEKGKDLWKKLEQMNPGKYQISNSILDNLDKKVVQDLKSEYPHIQ